MRREAADIGAYGPEDLNRFQAAYNFLIQMLSKKHAPHDAEQVQIARLIFRTGADRTLSCEQIIARCATELGLWIAPGLLGPDFALQTALH